MMRRFTFTGQPGGDGCLFADGTLATNDYSSLPFYVYISLAAFAEHRPEAQITWLDPEEAE